MRYLISVEEKKNTTLKEYLATKIGYGNSVGGFYQYRVSGVTYAELRNFGTAPY